MRKKPQKINKKEEICGFKLFVLITLKATKEPNK